MNHYKAVFFDLNGTLVNIRTDEGREEIYHTVAGLLQTYGVELSAGEFRTLFFDLMKEQKKKHEHGEFDVLAIFRTILSARGSACTRGLSAGKKAQLPGFLAETFRAASLMQLETYPGVHRILEELRREYALAAVSDAQKIWADPELRRLGLAEFFPVCVISSTLGVRKPSPLIFETALQKLSLEPQEVIFVGNDMYRDVYGAKKLGMKSVFFRSNQGEQNFCGEEPDYIIYRFEELPEAIRFLERKASGN